MCLQRGSSLVIQVIALVLASAFAFGQTLDLPRRSDPPSLAPPNSISELLPALEAEIEHFAGIERSATASQQIVIRASLNLRIIAAELLAQGEDAQETGIASTLYGLRIAHGREALDQFLIDVHRSFDRAQQEIGPDEQSDRAALNAVRRFNELAVDLAGSIRTVDADALERALPRIIAPLAEAVALHHGHRLSSHWPTVDEVSLDANEAPMEPEPMPDAPDRIAELRHAMQALDPSESVRTAFEDLLTAAEKGLQFADLQPRVERALLQLEAHVQAREAIVGARSLLPETSMSALDRVCDDAVLLMTDPSKKDSARVQLDFIMGITEAIRVASSLRNTKEDVDSIVETIDAIVSQAAEAADSSYAISSLRRLRVILDRMATFRTLPDDEPVRPFSVTHRRLRQAYESAEQMVLRRLPRLVMDEAARTDPALTTLLADHAQHLEDLARIRRVPRWVEVFESIDSRAAAPFASEMRRRCQSLLEPQRRTDAIRELELFESQLRRFMPLPLESELTTGSSLAINATGGLHAELAAMIDELRRAWVDAWARGVIEGVEAIDQLQHIARLMQTITDLRELMDEAETPPLLARWAAWESPDELLARTGADLPARLKLASASAAQRDWRALEAELRRIDRDAPLARLIGRLTARLRPALSARPDGASGVLSQLLYAPQANAWVGDERWTIAWLCRYATEAMVAEEHGKDERARSLQTYANELAEALMRSNALARSPSHAYDGGNVPGRR